MKNNSFTREGKRNIPAIVFFCTFSLAIASCAGDADLEEEKEPAPSTTTQTEKIKWKDCGQIFKGSHFKEVQNNRKMHRIHYKGASGSSGSFLEMAKQNLDVEMKTWDEDLVGCWITDEKKRDLLLISENWGPEEFPQSVRSEDRSIAYEQKERTQDYEKVQLLADCQRSDLVHKTKEARPLALRVSLTDHTGLSDRTRAALLNNAARILVDNLDCENDIAFPQPGEVEFSS